MEDEKKANEKERRKAGGRKDERRRVEENLQGCDLRTCHDALPQTHLQVLQR